LIRALKVAVFKVCLLSFGLNRVAGESWADALVIRAGAYCWKTIGATAMLSERFVQWEKEFLDRGRREGWEKGREEGRQEGIQIGVCQLLMLLLRRRFGELPESVQSKLRGVSAKRLEKWSALVLEANKPDELLACIELMCRAD
jgi:hypothetical protein